MNPIKKIPSSQLDLTGYATIEYVDEKTIFRGSINLSTPSPTIVGIYQPSVGGTYTNFGGVVVDLTAGYTTITFDGTNYSKQVNPISLASSDDHEFYGVVRYIPLTSTWELFTDSEHSSKNITSVISDATTNGFKINPTYPSDALYNIGTVNITPDESLVRSGISTGASFGFTQITCPVIQNQGFGYIMNGTTILSDLTHIVPQPYDLSWDATAMSLTLDFRGIGLNVGQGLGASNFNINITPGSNANFWFNRYDISYIPNGVKIKMKFYDLAGNVVTPTGRWIFNRTQPWQPLNNQLSKLGPNANFWVYGKYKKV